jgi:hypothetical protein
MCATNGIGVHDPIGRTVEYSYETAYRKFRRARSQNYKKRLLASSCLSVFPSVRMEKLGYNWTDLDEIDI